MRTRLRALGACVVSAALTVVSQASAQDAPPPPDPVAAQPPPVTMTPAPARAPIARFDDETPETHAAARLSGPTDARTEPTDAGQLVAHLSAGAIVTRLASRGDAVLVQLDDPENPQKLLMGWVPGEALREQHGQLPNAAKPVGPDVIKTYDSSDPVPAGYHTETRVRLGLAIGGGVAFGAWYVLSALVGALASNGPLLVPVVGPFLVVGQCKPSCSGLDNAFDELLVLDGVVQAAGLAMLIVGIAAPKTILVRDHAGARVTPMTMGKDAYGLGVVGSF